MVEFIEQPFQFSFIQRLLVEFLQLRLVVELIIQQLVLHQQFLSLASLFKHLHLFNFEQQQLVLQHFVEQLFELFIVLAEQPLDLAIKLLVFEQLVILVQQFHLFRFLFEQSLEQFGTGPDSELEEAGYSL